MYIKPKESYVYDQSLFTVGNLITYSFVDTVEGESTPYNGLISYVTDNTLEIRSVTGDIKTIDVRQLDEFPIGAEKLQPTVKILGIISNAIQENETNAE